MTTADKNTDRRRLRLVPREKVDLVTALLRERHGDQAELERERFNNLTTERAA